MSQAPISPLRRRMIEDMTVRGFGEKTQSDYIRHVKNFTLFLGRSPDQAQCEDLRLYQVHQRKQGVQPPTMNGAVAALRFFFTTTCNRPEMARHLTLVRQPQKLPVVLTPEEVARLIEAAPSPKYKAALAVAYGAVRKILIDTARRLGPKGRDPNFGAGLVNAFDAVRAAKPNIGQ